MSSHGTTPLRLTFLLAVLLGVCALALVNRLGPRELLLVESLASADPLAGRSGPAILEGRTPEEVLRRLHDAYRLAPDRRFLLALEQVDEILGREQRTSVTARFEDGGWTLASNGAPLARVGEHPGFGELFGFVRAEVAERTRGADLGFAAAAPGSGGTFPPLPLAALEEIDSRADRVDLVAAAHAYASLLLSHEDSLETSDEVAARAIAVLALAEHVTGEGSVRPRALIAHRLGYEREAEVMAAALPSSDPLRHFIERDHQALRAAANRPDVPLDVALMYANALITGGHREEFIRYAASLRPEVRGDFGILVLNAIHGAALQPDLELLARGLVDLFIASGSRLDPDPHSLARMAADEVIARFRNRPPFGLIGRVEAMLRDLEQRPGGRLLDAATRAAVHRARIHTGLERVGADYVDRLASRPAIEQFAAFLGRGTSPIAQEFTRYYATRVAAREGRLMPGELVANLDLLESFGPLSLQPLYEAIEAANYDEMRLEAIKLLVRRADTRVAHRELVAHMARDGLLDIALWERLGRSVLRDWPRRATYLHAVFAMQDGDLDAVERWLVHTPASPWLRANVLDLLAHYELWSESEIRREYERLIAIDPTDWSVVDRYVSHLNERGEHAEAGRFVEAWLAREDRRSGMPELAARTAWARSLHERGDLDAAWQAVARPLAGMFGAAFSRAALIRLDQGRFAEAEELCRRSLDRYPGDVALTARLARVFWRQDRHDEAAAALTREVDRIAFTEWREPVGPNFVTEFAGAPAERVDAAIDGLSKAGVHAAALEQLAFAAEHAGEVELAFRVVSRVASRNRAVLPPIITAYRFLEKLRGEEAAKTWLREILPAAHPTALAQWGYGARQYEIPWDLVPDPTTRTPRDDYVWLTRAASYLRDGAIRDDWRRRLEEYYVGKPRSFYDRLGAMLLGRVDVEDAWSAAQQLDQRMEAAYFIAVRAETSGDIEAAVAWYRIVAEGGLRNEGENHWSLGQLYRFRSKFKSMARLAAEQSAGARGVTAARVTNAP